jgi:transcriptional regulator with XRE-family HTH domain
MTEQLPRLVRSRREMLSWTQGDLAAAMGSSRSRISKLEAGDSTVAPSLMVRALAVMGAVLHVTLDEKHDAFAEPGLTESHRQELSARLLRRRRAERIAERHNLDAGDVEHALFNLTLPPWTRLARSFKRARLGRLSPR